MQIKIVKYIYSTGIIHNIDNQLRLFCGKEIRLKKTPWVLVCGTNQGDCLKTENINPSMRLKLMNL